MRRATSPTSAYTHSQIPESKAGNSTSGQRKNLVEVVTLRGKEYLLYHSFPVNVAFIRGTTADPDGNISMEEEAAYFEMLSDAQAARNSGGKVIAQVKRMVGKRGIDPRMVKIPGTRLSMRSSLTQTRNRPTRSTMTRPYAARLAKVT